MTTYLDPTGDQSHEFWRRDLCVICGSADDPKGCFCRACLSCSQYWLASTRVDGCDGRPRREDCPACIETDKHALKVHSTATGESSCSCGYWAYHVRNFRPMWPMDPEAVKSQVKLAFAAHARFQQTDDPFPLEHKALNSERGW